MLELPGERALQGLLAVVNKPMKIEACDWTGVEDPYNPGVDFPTAWAIQREVGDKLEHLPRCSSVPGWHPMSGPGFLCDCGAITREHERRKADALHPEQQSDEPWEPR